jgi:hypothetical protein
MARLALDEIVHHADRGFQVIVEIAEKSPDLSGHDVIVTY